MAKRRSLTVDEECARWDQLLRYERGLREQGLMLVAGIDEVGRGCLAGPVLAAAVILPERPQLTGINDSKLLTARRREQLASQIKAQALDWTVAVVAPAQIDKINILNATRRAMKLAVQALKPQPQYLLVDAVQLPDIPLPQQAIIKGDQLSMSIAAASILAKVERDALMTRLDELYPGYGFARHFGYGTAQHLRALDQYGPCPQHRMSFAPLKIRAESAAALF